MKLTTPNGGDDGQQWCPVDEMEGKL